MVGCVGAAVK